MKRKLRVLVLVHEQLVPPATLKHDDLEKVPWRTEFYVASTLRQLGHEPLVLGLKNDLAPIKDAYEQFKPHLAFNLLEEFNGEAVFDHNVVSYLELLGLPYSGCNPKGLLIARDKALAKKILCYHRIPTPRFYVVPLGKKLKIPKHMRFPMIVKSLLEEGSWGISQNSIVNDPQKLEERVHFIHENVSTNALVEEYIEGRDLYVSVMGNSKLTVLPFVELNYKNAPTNVHQIASRKAKWNPEYRRKYEIELEPIILAPVLSERVTQLSKRIYRLLGLSGYARLDLRISNKDNIYFLEANPNPDIAYGDEFALSAKEAGISYPELINKLLYMSLNWLPQSNYHTYAA
jgi:D-alanine-D-alanine ligase